MPSKRRFGALLLRDMMIFNKDVQFGKLHRIHSGFKIAHHSWGRPAGHLTPCVSRFNSANLPPCALFLLLITLLHGCTLLTRCDAHIGHCVVLPNPRYRHCGRLCCVSQIERNISNDVTACDTGRFCLPFWFFSCGTVAKASCLHNLAVQLSITHA